jgi:hypothetical protein
VGVKVQYSSIDGLNLPKTVDAVAKLPTGTVNVAFALAGCRVKKH